MGADKPCHPSWGPDRHGGAAYPHGHDLAVPLVCLDLEEARPLHLHTLLDPPVHGARIRAFTGPEIAGEGRRGSTCRRVFGDAEQRREHAGVETRLVRHPAAAIDEGVDQLAVGHRRQLFPARSVAARLGGDRQVVHRHHHERNAGVPLPS